MVLKKNDYLWLTFIFILAAYILYSLDTYGAAFLPMWAGIYCALCYFEK